METENRLEGYHHSLRSCAERLILCIDVSAEMDEPLGTNSTRFKQCCAALEMFVQMKAALNPSHEFAIVALCDEAEVCLDFTSKIEDVMLAVSQLRTRPCRPAFPLSSMFEVCARLGSYELELGSKLERLDFILRTVMVFGRSHATPVFEPGCAVDYAVMLENPAFFIDCIYLHDKIGAGNCAQDVWDVLTDLEPHSELKSSFLYEVTGSATRFLRNFAALLAHAVQRCDQDDFKPDLMLDAVEGEPKKDPALETSSAPATEDDKLQPLTPTPTSSSASPADLPESTAGGASSVAEGIVVQVPKISQGIVVDRREETTEREVMECVRLSRESNDAAQVQGDAESPEVTAVPTASSHNANSVAPSEELVAVRDQLGSFNLDGAGDRKKESFDAPTEVESLPPSVLVADSAPVRGAPIAPLSVAPPLSEPPPSYNDVAMMDIPVPSVANAAVFDVDDGKMNGGLGGSSTTGDDDFLADDTEEAKIIRQ